MQIQNLFDETPLYFYCFIHIFFVFFPLQKSRSQYSSTTSSSMAVVYQQSNQQSSRNNHSNVNVHYQSSSSSSNTNHRDITSRVIDAPPPQPQPPAPQPSSAALVREQIQNHPSYHQLPRAELKPFDSYFNDDSKAPVMHHSNTNGPPNHMEERMPRMSNPPLEGIKLYYKY